MQQSWRHWRSPEDAATWLTLGSALSVLFSIAVSQILLGMALAVLIVSRKRWKLPPIALPLGLFLLATLVSAAVSGHPLAAFPQVKKFYVYLILVLFATFTPSLERVRLLVVAWAALATLSAAWGVAQFVGKYEEALELHRNFYLFYVGERVTGFMSHWMTFGGELMIVLLMAAALLFFADFPHKQWLWVAVAAIGLGLVVGYTRSIWLGAAAGAVYLLWFWRRWLILALPVALALLLWIDPAQFRDRVVSAFEPHGTVDSNLHRYICRQVGYQMIRAHPWFGVGPEEVGPQFLRYLPADIHLPLPPGYYGHLHNIYVHYAAERGLPAALFLMWMLGRILFDFVRSLRRLPAAARDERAVLHGALAVLIGILVYGFYELNVGDSEVLTLFLAVVGCGYAAVARAPRDA